MKSNCRDPFSLKHLPRYHPKRLAFTVYARAQEKLSAWYFDRCALPLANEQPSVDVDEYDGADTAVTPPQMAMLDFCVRQTNDMHSPVVEVGAFRGVTTSRMAALTGRQVVAVDPYIGYGGVDEDLASLQHRIRGLPHVSHLRMTSGEASRLPSLPVVSFVFIDAVHDYVNVLHDGTTWAAKLEPGGLIAFHDTDSRNFSGVQRAVWRMAMGKTCARLELLAHTHGLVVLQRA